VTRDAAPRSFDQPRGRVVPASFTGVDRSGRPAVVDLGSPCLVLVVKPNCDGCRDALASDLQPLDGVAIVAVSPTAGAPGEWDSARVEVVVAPEFLEALDVRFPPVYLLVDAARGRVLTEGVLFDAVQVASEVAPYL